MDYLQRCNLLARSLQDEELVEICNSSDRPEREKFILRKKHHPVNHVEFKKYHATRMAQARLDPRTETSPPAGSRQQKLTKIFGARPPSELITSSAYETGKAELRESARPQTPPQARPRNAPKSEASESPGVQASPLDGGAEIAMAGSADGNRSNRTPARSRPHQC